MIISFVNVVVIVVVACFLFLSTLFVLFAAPHYLPFYPSIEMDTGKHVTRVPDWLAKQAPGDAAAGAPALQIYSAGRHLYPGGMYCLVLGRFACQSGTLTLLFSFLPIQSDPIRYDVYIFTGSW